MEKDIGHTLNETQANKIRRPHYGKSSFVRWDNLVYVSTYVVESDPKTISLKNFLFLNQKYLTHCNYNFYKINIIYQILDLNKVIMIWTKITRYIIKSVIFFSYQTLQKQGILCILSALNWKMYNKHRTADDQLKLNQSVSVLFLQSFWTFMLIIIRPTYACSVW